MLEILRFVGFAVTLLLILVLTLGLQLTGVIWRTIRDRRSMSRFTVYLAIRQNAELVRDVGVFWGYTVKVPR